MYLNLNSSGVLRYGLPHCHEQKRKKSKGTGLWEAQVATHSWVFSLVPFDHNMPKASLFSEGDGLWRQRLVPTVLNIGRTVQRNTFLAGSANQDTFGDVQRHKKAKTKDSGN